MRPPVVDIDDFEGATLTKDRVRSPLQEHASEAIAFRGSWLTRRGTPELPTRGQ
jgi:hypothetical protein